MAVRILVDREPRTSYPDLEVRVLAVDAETRRISVPRDTGAEAPVVGTPSNVPAQYSTGTLVVTDAKPKVAPLSAVSTATAAGQDATVFVGNFTNAPAGTAAATSVAGDSGAAVAQLAETATASFLAQDATAVFGVAAATATAAGVAHDTKMKSSPVVEAATATATAEDAVVNVGGTTNAAAEAATATVAIQDATTRVPVSPVTATASAVAGDATVVTAGSLLPTIKEKLAPAGVAAASQTLVTSSSVGVGDRLVLFHFYDYYTYADMLTPTGTSGGWIQETGADAGAFAMHVKVWTRAVTVAGAQTVTVNSTTTDATHMPALFVLDGSSFDVYSDSLAGANGAASTSHVCPSVSPVGFEGNPDLLLCAAGTSPDQVSDYTAPSGMIKETEVDVGTFSTAATFSQNVSPGATGTRTATSTANQAWCAVSIAFTGLPRAGTFAAAQTANATAVVSDAAVATSGGATNASAQTATATAAGQNATVSAVALTPVIREKLTPTPVVAGSMTMTTAAGTAAGDLLVLFHFYDYNDVTDMLTPTGGGTWTLQATGDGGFNIMHLKIWTRPVTSGGAQTVTVNSTTTDASHMPQLFVLNGSQLALSVDGAAGSNGAAGTAHVAPAVSPTGSKDLLLCGTGTSPNAAADYTAPAGMVKEAEVDADIYSTAATYSLGLTAAGSTGTKTATSTTSQEWCSGSIVIQGLAGTQAPAGVATATGAGQGDSTVSTPNAPAQTATATASAQNATTANSNAFAQTATAAGVAHPAVPNTGGTAKGATLPASVGLPAGTTLTDLNNLVISTNNTIVDGRRLVGDGIQIEVQAGVTGTIIRNCFFVGGPARSRAIQTTSATSLVIIQDCTFEGYYPNNHVCGDNFRVQRCEFRFMSDDAVNMGENCELLDSWIHDAHLIGSGAHADGMQGIDTPHNITIRNCLIDIGLAPSDTGDSWPNSSLIITPWTIVENGPGNYVIDHNTWGGGGFTFHLDIGFSSGIYVTDNKFLDSYGAGISPSGGNIFPGGPQPEVWTGNVHADGVTPIAWV
jgi:hypothetical protein